MLTPVKTCLRDLKANNYFRLVVVGVIVGLNSTINLVFYMLTFVRSRTYVCRGAVRGEPLCHASPLLVLGKIMPKANNCLKIFCYRWASCLMLTHELQTFCRFLDTKQKSHEQVLLLKNLAAITYRCLTR